MHKSKSKIDIMRSVPTFNLHQKGGAVYQSHQNMSALLESSQDELTEMNISRNQIMVDENYVDNELLFEQIEDEELYEIMFHMPSKELAKQQVFEEEKDP